MTVGKLLLVDVERRYLERIEAIAVNAGLEPCYAASAEEAWSLIVEGGISLMLVSPAIPGTNGCTLATMARHLCPEMVVIMLSEEADLEASVISGSVVAKIHPGARNAPALQRRRCAGLPLC